MFIFGHLFRAIAVILDKTLYLYSWVVLVAVLLTWVSPDPSSPLVRLLRSVTEPVFDWVRRHLPFAQVGMLDLAPMLVLFTIWFLRLFLVPSLFDLGYRLQ